MQGKNKTVHQAENKRHLEFELDENNVKEKAKMLEKNFLGIVIC